MTKMLSDDSGLQPALKSELEKVLALISNVNANSGAQGFSQRNEEAAILEHTLIQEESKECAGNMTMSELQLHNDSQLG